jgi:D-alanine--D-alanine ligase
MGKPGNQVKQKLRIGVLMGGRSIEREVSFNSGRTICDHIDLMRYDVVPIFQKMCGGIYLLPWQFLHRGKTDDFINRLDEQATGISWDALKQYVDFIYIAVHGRYAEDGKLQGMLEVLDIPYTGAKVFGSAAGMDKVFQKHLLQAEGVCVPRGFTVAEHEAIRKDLLKTRLQETSISFPCIVKPAHEGSSLGVTVVCSTKELLSAVQKARHIDQCRTQDVIVEEKIEGMEFNFVALQDDGVWKTLPLAELIVEEGSHLYDYEQKYMPGRATKITPARCRDEQEGIIKQTCIKVCQILDFETLARIDGFLTKDNEVVIIDPNSLSGMGPSSFVFHQAAQAGINHMQFINHIIDAELKRSRKQYQIAGAYKDWEGDKVVGLSKQKIRVVVLFGGDSAEKEISLESGRNVCYKLSPEKYEVIPVFVNQNLELYRLSQQLLIKNATHEIVPLLTDEIKIGWADLSLLSDFVFIALHGGKGENGSVQGFLEMLDVPYNGSGVLASALCMDKYRTKLILQNAGLAVPRGIMVDRSWWLHLEKKQTRERALRERLTQLSFPVIVKPHDDGCSFFVEKIDNFKQLPAALDLYFQGSKHVALIEECLQGMELTVGVLGNNKVTVLPSSYSRATSGNVLSIEDKFLPGYGENQTPAPLLKEERQLVRKAVSQAYKLLGCKGYVRVDCFFQNETVSPTKKARVVIFEINSLPALTPATCLFAQAAEVGIRPMEFIDKIIELGFELHCLEGLVATGYEQQKEKQTSG